MSSAKKKLLGCFINAGCGCGKPKSSEAIQPEYQNPKQPGPSRRNLPHRNRLFPVMFENNGRGGGDDDDDDGYMTSYTTATPYANGSPVQSPYANDGYSLEAKPRTSLRVVSPCRKITNSIAFVKESEDPYRDFRRSMLQMIFEREIRSKDDFQELLNCFLQLNPPSQHDAIILAFTEIWNGVFSEKNNSNDNRETTTN